MADIVINDEQQNFIIGIVDKYIKLHKNTHKMYCVYPEKQRECEYNSTYDCSECTNKYYEEQRKSILNKCGL